MKRLLLLVIALSPALAASAAAAPTPAPPQMPGQRWRVLDFAASNSRGVYAAGVAYGLLQQMRSRDSGRLVGAAGTSFGALNALLSSLAWCRKDFDVPEKSPLFSTWAGNDWRLMFPGDRTCEEFQALNPEVAVVCTGERPFRPDDALFSSNGFDLLAQKLLQVMGQERGWRHCDIPVGFQLIAETPVAVNLGAYRTSTSRRYVAVRLQTDEGKPAVLRQIGQSGLNASLIDEQSRAFEQVLLPSTAPWSAEAQPINPRTFIEMMAASLSQPPMVVTPAITYCGKGCLASQASGLFCPENYNLCEQRFYDAAIFDRVPLAVGRLLTPNFDEHVVIDPSSKGLAGNDSGPAFRGSGLYGQLIDNLSAVATDYETQILARQRNLSVDSDATLDGKRVLEVPTRRPLVGDLFFGTGAYFDERFRRHDYFAGIFDALSWSLGGECARCTGLEHQRQRAVAVLSEFKADLLTPDINRPPGLTRQSVGLTEMVLRSLENTLCRDPGTEHADCPAIRRSHSHLSGHRDARDVRLIAEALDRALAGTSNSSSVQAGHDFARALRKLGFDPERRAPFISAHEYWWDETLRQAVGRLRDIEADQGNRGLAALLGLTEYGVAISASRRKLGWQLGPATIPDRVSGNGALAAAQKLLVPYTAAADFTNGGGLLIWETASYRIPQLAWARLPILGATYHWYRYGKNRGRDFGPFLGLEAGLDNALISDIGLRAWWHPSSASTDWESLGGEVYIRPFWGRLELSLGMRSLHCTGSCRDPGVFASLGIADVNGLAYWILRAATGTASFHEVAASGARGRLGGVP